MMRITNIINRGFLGTICLCLLDINKGLVVQQQGSDAGGAIGGSPQVKAETGQENSSKE